MLDCLGCFPTLGRKYQQARIVVSSLDQSRIQMLGQWLWVLSGLIWGTFHRLNWVSEAVVDELSRVPMWHTPIEQCCGWCSLCLRSPPCQISLSCAPHCPWPQKCCLSRSFCQLRQSLTPRTFVGHSALPSFPCLDWCWIPWILACQRGSNFGWPPVWGIELPVDSHHLRNSCLPATQIRS